MILGEIFSDYTPAQVVVKELRASAGPLEQRKFISEAQPYRYWGLLGGRGPWRPKYPSLRLMEITFGRNTVWGQTWVPVLDLPSLPDCVTWLRECLSQPWALPGDRARDLK